jgi:hypothetical protein
MMKFFQKDIATQFRTQLAQRVGVAVALPSEHNS